MPQRRQVPCAIMRGGTSRGLFFLKEDIPPAGERRDAFLLRVMGSPDKKQIDGLGGAASVTSKVAIVSPSARADADVDYTFAQVSIDKPLVSYLGNCGNISSAVGPFAIERGLVRAKEPFTTVRIFNTNTGKVIESRVAVEKGQVKYRGDYAIPGVPGTAEPIRLRFVDPAGTLEKGLLPTGNVVDVLTVPGRGEVEVSIVDAANPLVFVRAEEIGMTGKELPTQIDGNAPLRRLLEEIRGAAAVRLGLLEKIEESAWLTPGIPKMTVVAPPEEYETADGRTVKADEVDLVGRMMSMQFAHPTYAMTGAMCTAAAAAIPDSVVAQVLSPAVRYDRIRIGHPAGVLEAGIEYRQDPAGTVVEAAYGYRTANFLMDGFVIMQ